MVQRAETTVAECSLSSYLWANFRIGGIVSPLRLHWVKGVCLFRCNLPFALLAEWPGSFACHCGNTGVERTPNKNQHTKLTKEKKNSPPLLLGFEPSTFRSRVRRSTNKLSRLPYLYGVKYSKFSTTIGTKTKLLKEEEEEANDC